jgi:hypothetical protein
VACIYEYFISCRHRGETVIHPSIQKVEERIADALISRAEEASKLRVRVIALEKLLRMIGEATKEADVRKLVALAFTNNTDGEPK